MFETTRPFLFFDYFRVPYRIGRAALSDDPFASWARMEPVDAESARRLLYWPDFDCEGEFGALAPGSYRLGSIAIFGRIVPDAVTESLLAGTAGAWRATDAVVDDTGAVVAWIWRDAAGGALLPFDPGEAIHAYWSEAYRDLRVGSLRTQLKRQALRSYYRVRPLLPRPAQIWLRRRFSRVQARTSFPRWPVELGLHDLYALIFRLVAEVAGEPVPHIAPWPAGYDWTLVLTHDVETEIGYRNIHLLRDLELAEGYRSSWNLVPRRYDVEDAVVDELKCSGFEVGVHGLYHDGRDLESAATLRERLPAIREYAERWGATGFRSPATHRDWELMPLLGFDYDSSYPDSDPFEPQAGGCCSFLPFFNRDLVELPITLPQDHTLFVILRRRDEAAWVEKALAVREQGGMALVIVHPDYLLGEPLREIYARFLRRFRDEPRLWRALPSEVSDWWRRRAASTLELTPDGWRVVGPAADEGVVAFSDGT